MDIRKCISGLLTVHDCVILPGFGGFIGNYSPAHIDPVHHTFSPPFKKLLFNINLKQNDGLLANCIAEEEGLDYTTACQLIEEMLDECRHALKSGQSFVIPEVGRLFTSREGNIQFEQDKKANLLPAAFGLSTFISPPVLRNSYQTMLERNLNNAAVKQGEKKTSFPRPLKWAAAFAVPVGIVTVLGLTQYDKLQNYSENNAGILSAVFSRFSSTALVEKKEAPKTPVDDPYTYQPTPSVFDVLPDEEQVEPDLQTTEENLVKTEPRVVTEEKLTETPPAIIPGNSFAIIVGAFKVKDNAEKFVSTLTAEGKSALIFDRSKTGLYRVALTTCSNRSEAEQILAQVKSGEFSGAWLLAK